MFKPLCKKNSCAGITSVCGAKIMKTHTRATVFIQFTHIFRHISEANTNNVLFFYNFAEPFLLLKPLNYI